MSQTVATTTPQPAVASNQTKKDTPTPHTVSLKNASVLSIEQDKPIMLDYYIDSMNGRCRLVKTQDQDTILFKNKDEHTSPLKKVMQVDASRVEGAGFDIICVSENSIYLVHSAILSNR
jgi:hypothetical protein